MHRKNCKFKFDIATVALGVLAGASFVEMRNVYDVKGLILWQGLFPISCFITSLLIDIYLYNEEKEKEIRDMIFKFSNKEEKYYKNKY